MRSSRLIIIFAGLMLVVGGCRKKEPAESEIAAQKNKAQREAAMNITLQWLGHASFRISDEDNVIYIDPWKIANAAHDATIVLVSHSHSDHYSAEDIGKVSGPGTKLIAVADVIAKQGAGESIMPGLTIEAGGIMVHCVPSYNPNKQFHPKKNNWAGFIIQIGSKRIYYSGDTDIIEEMKTLGKIDLAMLPVGGTYTMNGEEAAKAAGIIKPKMAIPYHWGDVVGGKSDAEQFAKDADCDVNILAPGETIKVE